MREKKGESEREKGERERERERERGNNFQTWNLRPEGDNPDHVHSSCTCFLQLHCLVWAFWFSSSSGYIFAVLSVLFVLVLCLLAHQLLLIACLPIVGDYFLQLNF